jgi:hypothetical protein
MRDYDAVNALFEWVSAGGRAGDSRGECMRWIKYYNNCGFDLNWN